MCAVIEDVVSDQDYGADGVILGFTDCAYIATEFALVLKLTVDGSARGEDGAQRLSECLQQLLQVWVCSFVDVSFPHTHTILQWLRVIEVQHFTCWYAYLQFIDANYE